MKIAGYAFVGMMMLLAGCAKQAAPPAVDLAAEESAIRATDAAWQASGKSRDMEKALSYWADDSIMYAPNMPAMVGKPAIRAYVTGAVNSPDFSISWVTDKVVVARSGDMAYSTGTNQITYRDPTKNKLMTEKSHGIVVWRKQADGSWKAQIDIWNDAAPGSGAKK
jgi:ketosteroid isomerase-like protein